MHRQWFLCLVLVILSLLGCATNTATPQKQVEETDTNAASPFRTPRTTFEYWRAAAIEGDVDKMVRSYASFKQSEKRKELKKLKRDALEQMRSATAETKFTPAEPLYQGDHATLDVNWTKGVSGDSQVLQFILEKNEWKIIQ